MPHNTPNFETVSRRHAEPRSDCNRISRPSRAAGSFARSLALGVAAGAPAVGVCGGNRIGGYARRDVVGAARWLECPRLPYADPLSVDWPLACTFLALRHGAPTRPGLAGAVAGLVASGIAATLYASHCTDDSPLFVATWYPLAIGIVVRAGYVAGSRYLRW